MELTGCSLTTSSHCLRCTPKGCIKCPAFLVADTRQCVEQCASGYTDQWSPYVEFMGRVCISKGYWSPLKAAIAGLIAGLLLYVSLLVLAVMLLRRSRRNIRNKLMKANVDQSKFLWQLNELRPNAEHFLAMLNDTRRQIRKLTLSGDIAAAKSCRPIVSDLTKLLVLFNWPVEFMPAVPHDWNRLYTWSKQALERYKPEVRQLIDFFQTPGADGISDAFGVTSAYQRGNLMSTLRESVLASTKSTPVSTRNVQSHLFDSLISLHDFEEPRPTNFHYHSFNNLKSENLLSNLNASSLWLEDEFYKLGFRPQDEITTEL